MILGGSSLVRYLRLMCSMGSPNTMLLSPPGGFRTLRLDRCWLCGRGASAQRRLQAQVADKNHGAHPQRQPHALVFPELPQL